MFRACGTNIRPYRRKAHRRGCDKLTLIEACATEQSKAIATRSACASSSAFAKATADMKATADVRVPLPQLVGLYGPAEAGRRDSR